MSTRRRILIAEDVAANAALFSAVLDRAGFAVDVAPDGEAAVALGVSQNYAVILMDLGLPLLDGVEAARRIRATRPNANILALTAECDPKINAACAEVGMAAVLCKPLSPSALLREIEARLAAPV